jgi:hypothetical protein
LPKSLFSGSEALFDKSKALAPRQFKKRPVGSNHVVFGTSPRFIRRKRFNEVQKDFVWATTLGFGTSQWLLDANIWLASVIKSL